MYDGAIQTDVFTILTGSNLDHLPSIGDASVDSCVTDPPYRHRTKSRIRRDRTGSVDATAGEIILTAKAIGMSDDTDIFDWDAFMRDTLDASAACVWR